MFLNYATIPHYQNLTTYYSHGQNGITNLYVKLQKTQHSLDLDKKLSKLVGIVIKIISMKIQELFPFASLAQCGKTRNLHSTQKYFVKSTR